MYDLILYTHIQSRFGIGVWNRWNLEFFEIFDFEIDQIWWVNQY